MSITVPVSPRVDIVDRRMVTVLEAVYEWRGRRLTVEAGFITDLASLPKIVRPLFPVISEARAKGAIGHDKLHATHCFDDGPCTRHEANRFMFDVCIAEGMPVYRALLIRWGLFVGSWWPWYGWRMTWLGPRRRRR